jgi:membrane dipeptidase
MKVKKYAGYESFKYLGADTDFPVAPLVTQDNRVAPYDMSLNSAELARLEKIYDDNVIVSLHEHAVVFPDDIDKTLDYNRDGRQATGYSGLSKSGLDCLFDNLMNGMACVTSKMGWKWNDIIHDLGMRLADIAHQDYAVHATRLNEIYSAAENGQLAIVMALEAATGIENEVDRLDVLYGLGVRQVGIVYNEANALGCGLKERSDSGLSHFGRKAVKRMNALGMAIDISHAGDQTGLDTIRHSTKPVLITHAGARSVWPTQRMKPDEVIRECVERGGLIGIEAAPHTTLSHDHPRHSLESVMDHFRYCVDLVGIDGVTFGPDTLYGDHVGLHRVFEPQMVMSEITSGPAFERVEYVAGVENPTEGFRNITAWLIKHGYSDDEIAAVQGRNVLRVLERIWET